MRTISGPNRLCGRQRQATSPLTAYGHDQPADDRHVHRRAPRRCAEPHDAAEGDQQYRADRRRAARGVGRTASPPPRLGFTLRCPGPRSRVRRPTRTPENRPPKPPVRRLTARSAGCERQGMTTEEDSMSRDGSTSSGRGDGTGRGRAGRRPRRRRRTSSNCRPRLTAVGRGRRHPAPSCSTATTAARYGWPADTPTLCGAENARDGPVPCGQSDEELHRHDRAATGPGKPVRDWTIRSTG